MTQPDDPLDPYRLPPPQPGPEGAPHGTPRQGPPPQPEYPTYPGRPQAYPQGYPDQPVGDGSVAALQAQRPPSVTRLLQVMTAGAVITALQGVYALLTVDSTLAAAGSDLDQIAADSGMDPAQLASIASTSALVVGVASLVISVGLWVLFARLFSRGSGRVVGTVLGALNGVGSLFGLLQPVSAVSVLLNLVVLAAVVAGLVLLWVPTTSAWFRAVAAAKVRPSWG